MDRAGVGKACLALPGATMDHPFGPGHDAYKVGGKMFAIILMVLKVLVNFFLWGFSIFIAPVGILYLWFRSRNAAA